MHELSLSYATVETVLESVASQPVKRIISISLRAGELSGVSLDAFRFSFSLAAAGTLAEDCELLIEVEPVTVYCSACNSIGKLLVINRFRCPACDLPTADVRSGKDFSILAINIETTEVRQYEHANC